MAIINTNLGGTDASNGEVLNAADLNDTYDAQFNRVTNFIKGNSCGLKRIVTNTKIPISSTTWIGIDGSNITRTTDSGDNYSTVYTGTATKERHYRHPTDSSKIIMWDNNGTDVVYSTDSGATWTSVDTSGLSIYTGAAVDTAFSITDTDRIYIYYFNSASSNNDTLGYTDDDGVGWTTSGIGAVQGAASDQLAIQCPTNDVYSLMAFDDSGNDVYHRMKVESTTYTNMNDATQMVIPSHLVIYIDSDNYFLSSADSDKDGLRRVKWKGTTLMTGNEAFDGQNGGVWKRYLLRFDANDFVYLSHAQTNERTTSTVFRYDVNGDAYQLGGVSYYSDLDSTEPMGDTFETDLFYYGVDGTSGNHIIREHGRDGTTSDSQPNDLLDFWDIWRL